MWPTGAAALQRWGLFDRVLASGCPPLDRVLFDFGPFTLTGSPPSAGTTATFLAPRRSVLDQVLVEAAVEAGVELRERCSVVDVISQNERVTGVQCRTDSGATVAERARIVIGADGRNSGIARAVKADEYNARPTRSCWYYAYWSGIAATSLELYSRPGRAFAVIPTNNDQVCIPVAWTAAEFHEYRADIERNYLATLDQAPELAERVRQGERVERFVGMADLPHFFRTPYGAGWALVGDAGYHRDPITAQGISDAFRDAEALADAIDDGFSGRTSIEAALQRYHQSRDEQVMAMYELTYDWASLAPAPPEMEAFFVALIDNRPETDRFVGALAGTVPIPEFFSPENIERVIGAER
jgi:2-polyprenyl-6-methoxyphenol hydroxylase-like FAD-dependent oxidoreductase